MEKVMSLQEKYLQPPYPGYCQADLGNVESMWADAKLQRDLAAGRRVAGGEGVSDDLLKQVIADCLAQAHVIETAARNPAKWNLGGQSATSALVVVLSGPGTYFRPVKDDRYQGLDYAYNGDRERSDAAAILGIQLAGERLGEDFSEFPAQRILPDNNPDLAARREDTRAAILGSGVRFLYLGRPDEVEATRRAVLTKSSFIPPQAVTLISEGIDNAYDQANALRHFLSQSNQPRDQALYFALPLKAIRFFRFSQALQSIPEAGQTYLLPMATARSGFPDYARNEIAGVLNYLVQGKCSQTPTPYRVLGSRR